MSSIAAWFGLTNPAGTAYLFWSGIGSDLSELAIIGAAVSLYHKHNCHVTRCWRIGHHPAGPYIVCRRHHPDIPTNGPITTTHITDQH